MVLLLAAVEDIIINTGLNPVVLGLIAGLFIAFLNLVGALLVLIWQNPTEKWLDTALGFAAGVMLAASFTSLLLPGIEFASAPTYQSISLIGFELVGIIPVLIGFLLGTIILDRGERWIHYLLPIISSHLSKYNVQKSGDNYSLQENSSHIIKQGDNDSIKNTRIMSVLFFTVAVTLHNMPEGLAVGVGFGSGNIANAVSLMFAIGIQNIPEGLAISIAALNAGLGTRWYAAVAGIRAGLVEIPLAFLGAWAVTVSAPLLPYAMGFAAGGMLYVIGGEILPETHAHGYERIATLGFMAGTAIMLTLDVTLG